MTAPARLEPKVLFEDEVLIALDKPAGLLAHGAVDVASALRWLQEREIAAGRDPDRVYLVHRLDKDTSGVLLLAFSQEIASALGELFRNRRVLKIYLAVTSPVPGLRWQRVEHFLKPRRIGGGEYMAVADEGLEATSEVEVLSRGRRLALVRVIPDQGRKHQVRVALAASGAPICGDFLYGGALSVRLAKRTMLHARCLELAHPVTHAHLTLKAPLPADFRELMQEDGCIVPPDLDRRHRTEPKTRDRARKAQDPQGSQAKARAQVIEMPRGLPGQYHRKPDPKR